MLPLPTVVNGNPESSNPPRSAIPDAAIRTQLAAILTSTPFATAQRSRRFLEFSVEQTLAGAQSSIKESVVALEVFDRKGDFDPRVDAIVRVEAAKLRTRLSEFYGGEGATAPILIEIPKGTYVPRFSQQPNQTEPTPAPPTTPPLPKALIATAIALALTLCIAAWLFLHRSRSSAVLATKDVPSVAVLPFLNLSSDPENAYFSDGLADQLTDAMAQVDGLRVASRTSAFSFRDKPGAATEIGAKLNVSALVEGSVQKSNDRVRITVQLIRTRDGYHSWSQTFDRDFKDIFNLQDEVARAVTRALKVSIADESSRKRSRRYTTDPEAFDLYLRGRHFLYSLQPGGADRAIAVFEQAIARDPRFALAYAGIAVAASQGTYTELLPPNEVARQVRAAAEKALQLDDTLAEAHADLAAVEAKFDWNWSGAEKRFRRSIALDPRSPDAHFAYANGVLAPMHRWEEALAECKLARELDPFSVQMGYCTPWIHMFQGKAELSLAEFKQLDAEQPGMYAQGVAISSMAAGRNADALWILERGMVDLPALIHQDPAHAAFLGYCYGRVGRTADALKIERQLRLASQTQYISPGAMSLVYLGLGQLDSARRAASEQIREHSFSIYTLSGPQFTPLRDDPQFTALLRTTGMPF